MKNNFSLEDHIKELEVFAKKRKLDYKREDKGIVIKNADGIYNIHIFITFDNFGRTVVRYVLGDSAYTISSSRYELNLGILYEMSILQVHLQRTYSVWLSHYKTWKSRSKYK